MYNFWHNIVLGRYSTEDRWVGLDYKSLFLDPVLAHLTYIHEITHGVLSRTTDFGQATEAIFQLLPKMKHISREDRLKIENALMASQMFVQEGSATLMETLMHKRSIGKQQALAWAKEHLPDDYYARLEKLLFVFDLGERYREEFTKKIPHLSLHTGIRKTVVEQDLLSDPTKFINYLKDPENNPNIRFQKMVDTIKSKTYLPTKDVSEISEVAGIKLYPDTSKEDAANFLNYLMKLTNQEHRFLVSDIGDLAKGEDAILQASEQTLVANINLNIQQTGIILWNLKDLLHYKDQTEAVLINRLGDDLDYRAELEQLTGKKYEAGFIAFTKTYDKYLRGLDFETVSFLLNNEYKDKTLIVKWGLYEVSADELNYFLGSRKPNVVLYNTVNYLQDKFKAWFDSGNSVEYVYLGASENHPFQTLILKDTRGILHLVNTYGNKHINDFLSKNKSNLKRTAPEEFIDNPQHLNNTLSVWMGLPWEVDWYHSMINGKELILRK